MRYIACFGAVVVFLSLSVAATYSQAGGSGGSSGSFSGSGGGGSGTSADPQGMRTDFQRRMADHQRDFQQRMDQMQRQAEESRNQNIRDMLRATDEQWQQLKPKLDRIERLKAEADVALEPGSFGSTSGFQGRGMAFGGGSMGGGGFSTGGMGPGQSQFRTWSWGTPSGGKSPMEMTAGEVLCQDLAHLLQGVSVSTAEVAQKVEALRRTRTKAREDLAAARKELRASISQQEEAPLVLMGYLD